MTPAEIAAIIAAFGGLRGVEAIITASWKAFSTKGQNRRSELDRAWSQVDRESQKRRIVERHAAVLDRMLIEAPCVDPADIPSWPSYGDGTGPTTTALGEKA